MKKNTVDSWKIIFEKIKSFHDQVEPKINKVETPETISSLLDNDKILVRVILRSFVLFQAQLTDWNTSITLTRTTIECKGEGDDVFNKRLELVEKCFVEIKKVMNLISSNALTLLENINKDYSHYKVNPIWI